MPIDLGEIDTGEGVQRLVQLVHPEGELHSGAAT
jgi:hypothetical protein